MSRRRSLGTNQGLAYVAILFVLIILTLLGISLIFLAQSQYRVVSDRHASMQADYLAEAAAHHALWDILHDDAFPPQDDVYYMHSFAGGRYGFKVRRHDNGAFAAIATVGAVGDYYSEQSYIVPIAATAATYRVLFVVTSTFNPSAQEDMRQALMESWGYTVSLIRHDASQSNYLTAMQSNEVVYVSEEIASTSVQTKLTGAGIGVVNEETLLTDELRFSSGNVTLRTRNQIQIVDNSHYITSPFAEGWVPILLTSQEIGMMEPGYASGLQTLAETSSGSGNRPSLAVLDVGAALYGSGRAAGRRVQLPWGGSTFDFAQLNNDGKTLMRRAIEWAAHPDAGLVGHWKLDDGGGATASDSSGFGHTGTLVNMASNDWVSGKIDGALDFDGSNDYVRVSNTSDLQLTSALTIAGWVKASSFGSSTDVDIVLRKGDDNPNNYQLAIADRRVALYLDDGDGGGVRGNTLLSTGVWYHVAGVWSGTDVRIYLNGVLNNTPVARTGTIPVDTRPLYLGGRVGADLFRGQLDDVRLYRRALSAAQIAALCALGN